MQMLKNARGLILGLVIGLFVGACATAYAAQTVHLIVNGQEIYSDVPAQIIEGRTLVPARALAEALGATVEWDEANNAVVVTGANEPVSPGNNNGKALSELDVLTKSSLIDFDTNSVGHAFSLNGTEYTTGICGTGRDGIYTQTVEYSLSGQYSRLTGLFGLDDRDWREGNEAYMVIYGNGAEIYRSPIIHDNDPPTNIDIDVSGINKLKIEFNEPRGGIADFANARLH